MSSTFARNTDFHHAEFKLETILYLSLLIKFMELIFLLIDILVDGNYRNKTLKRVTAINRELPPPNEQFLFDFEQIQSQFPVSF